MATSVLNTRISLRRGKESDYLVTFIPLKGELVFVDTDKGLKYKIGDGVTPFASLAYVSASDSVIVCYKFNNKFYTDSTYSQEVEKAVGKIYIDLISKNIYIYDSTNFKGIEEILPSATDTKAGLVKLYNIMGNNTDGTMTQASITKAISKIKLIADGDLLILETPEGVQEGI